jgi:hypothetical protein
MLELKIGQRVMTDYARGSIISIDLPFVVVKWEGWEVDALTLPRLIRPETPKKKFLFWNVGS